jgi:hypothetical protein
MPSRVWLPIRLDRETTFHAKQKQSYLRLIARLAPGVTLERADADSPCVARPMDARFPNNYKPSDPLQVDVRPIRDRVVGPQSPTWSRYLGAVGFVLLIACVNVANLLLARGEVRRKEMMIRSALARSEDGSRCSYRSRARSSRSAAACLVWAVAYPALRMIVAAAPVSIPRVGEIRLDVHGRCCSPRLSVWSRESCSRSCRTCVGRMYGCADGAQQWLTQRCPIGRARSAPDARFPRRVRR